MNNFFEFKNQTEESSDLFIYGDIISDEEARWYESDVSVKGFKEGLDSVRDGSTLNLYINSGGGSVFAASSMVNMLKRAKGTKNLKVIAYIDGLAASAASLFPFAADEAHVYTNSMLMIHKPSITYFLTSMNANDLRHEAETLDKIEESVLLTTYMSMVKDGTTETQMSHLINKETWFSADEIVEKFGFIKEESEKKVENFTSKFFDEYKHVPERFRPAKEDPKDEAPEDTEESKVDNSDEQGSDVDPGVDEIYSSDISIAKTQIMQMKKEI